MDFDKLFPGRFLKAGLLGGKDVTMTIRAVKLDKMPKDGGGEEIKAVMAFMERPLELVLNKTNALCIKEMFGRETDAWIGKRVTFCSEQFEGEPCIRVRGSPDLDGNKTFDLKLPRKKARRKTLIKTVPGQQAAPVQDDDGDGEPPAGVPLPTMNGTMTTT